MNRIGIINLGSVPAAINALVYHLARKCLDHDRELSSIEIDQKTGNAKLCKLDEAVLNKWRSLGGTLLHFSSTLPGAGSLLDFDHVIVLGGNEALAFTERNLSMTGGSKFLHLPVSIFNDVEESQTSLGYDTALNAIVNSIFRVKDTAGSLIYSKHRLFCIQVPGYSSTALLKDTALVVEGEVLLDPDDDRTMKQLTASIQHNDESGETYTLLLIHEKINPNTIYESISRSIEVDYKVMQLDEAQLMGTSTAADRVLAAKLADHAIRWINNETNSGKLLIKDYQIIFQKQSNEKGNDHVKNSLSAS
jgi:6-phosphofructokinase 1